MAATELLWIFFCYSVLGWVLETIFGTFKRKKFINRGLMNGPWCPVYGVSAVVIYYLAVDLGGEPFFLFLGSAIIAAFIEFITGQLMEKIFHKRLWDYSNLRVHADGYVSLVSALLWGAFGLAGYYLINPMLLSVYTWAPQLIRGGVLIFLSTLLAVDCLCTFSVLFRYQRNNGRLEAVNQELKRFTNRLGVTIGKAVIGRMEKNFSGIHTQNTVTAASKSLVFAQGCGFYKLALLFMIGAFLGDIIETIFCRMTTGKLMSRSSVVYGSFSIVWGLGIVILTAALYRYKDKADRYIILAGTLLGGVYEYLCSVFTERFLGTVFWDYSELPFNLGGRINLLYCFFWGIAALIWLKIGYPLLSRWIEKMPVVWGRFITWILIVFMIINMIISACALMRYNERFQGIEPGNSWEQFMDKRFNDNRMKRIYPNAIMKESG